MHRKFDVPKANGASVELYRKAERFITVTGRELGSAATTLANIDALLDATLAELDEVKKTKKRQPKHDLAKLIKDGCGQDFGGDRSRAVWYVINQLLRRGRATDDIVAILLDRDNGISAHIYDQPAPTNTRDSRSRRRRPSSPLGLPSSSRTATACPTAIVANAMIALRADTALSGAFAFDDMMQTQMLIANPAARA